MTFCSLGFRKYKNSWVSVLRYNLILWFQNIYGVNGLNFAVVDDNITVHAAMAGRAQSVLPGKARSSCLLKDLVFCTDVDFHEKDRLNAYAWKVLHGFVTFLAWNIFLKTSKFGSLYVEQMDF